jgi:hypothetical protein
VEALSSAEDITAELQRLRDGADTEFHDLYSAVTTVAHKYEFSLSRPRLASRQTKRCNVTATSDEEYYKIAIYIPFLDTFLSQLRSRFLNHKTILQGFQCLIPNDPHSISKEQLNDFANLVEFYSDDLDGNVDALVAELRLWYRRLSRTEEGSLPRNALDALRLCHSTVHPNIEKLLQILATLPVSTCTSERSFSTLRRLKTYLRNSTSETRLNGLALLHVHREMTPTTEEIINELLKKKRRLDFVL